MHMKEISAKPPVHIKQKKYRDAASGLLMALPPVVGFFLFGFIPQLVSLWLGFQELHSFDFSQAKFTGFSNFAAIFSDPAFFKSIGNTFFYMIATVVCIFLGLGIALLLSAKGVKGKKFFRSVFFIPYVCSVVATTVMWYWIFEKDFGILNGILGSLFGEGARVNWLDEEWPFRTALLVMLIWSGCGYNIILYQSAIAAVDRNLYEAAEIDGANTLQQFAHITWPSINPTTFYMLVMGVIKGLQAFTMHQIWGSQVGGGGPGQSAVTIVYYIYDKAWGSPYRYGMGYASAASWLLAILIGAITVVIFKSKKKESA